MSKNKQFPILYKYTSTGKIQQWQIFVDGDKFYTVEGLKDGKLTTSLPTYCKPKNVGKKNETTSGAQAIIEAQAKFQRKLDKGYNKKVSKKKVFFEPMLAEDYRDKATGETFPWVQALWDDRSLRKFVQPKLDGLRTINENGKLASRGGKPFVTCPHLCQDEVILDGELYNHKFKDDFNAIVSMIKQSKPTAEDLEHAKKYAEMWVYDFPGHSGPFSERYEKLKEWYASQSNPSIVLVPTCEVETEEDLKRLHEDFKSAGFEGTILRVDSGNYENKRTKQLIKYKDFIDEEFEIVGYEEGKGGRVGTIGKFILKHDKDPKKTFKSNVKGNFEYLRKVWAKRDSYVGKQATVQYFNRTPLKKDGKGDVPRFGYVIKIDRQSYE